MKSYLTVVESHDAAKISMLRLNIGSGKLSSCSALAEDPKPFKARGGLPPLALFAFGSEANAERA